MDDSMAEDPVQTYGNDWLSGTRICGFVNLSPDTFRAFSVGGTMSNNDWETCDPSEHVPVVHLQYE